MIEINELIKKAGYADADEIVSFLSANKITTVNQLSDSIVKIGNKINGHDIFQFVHALREAEAEIVIEKVAKQSISHSGDTLAEQIPTIEVLPEPTPSKPKGRPSKEKEE